MTSSEMPQCRLDSPVSVRETDYLDQDPPLRGQRYACVSFISPESILANKDAFYIGRFMNNLARDMRELLLGIDAKWGAMDADVAQSVRMLRERHAYLDAGEDMQNEYRAFREANSQQLEDDFRKEHGPGTSLRGLKIRGVYDSMDEASARARSIKKFDDRFNVYIAEVGCWCPWDPSPDAVDNAEYTESQLNTLMKGYRDGQDARDTMYEKRKHEMLERINNDRETWLEARKQELMQQQKLNETIAGSSTEPEQNESASSVAHECALADMQALADKEDDAPVIITE